MDAYPGKVFPRDLFDRNVVTGWWGPRGVTRLFTGTLLLEALACGAARQAAENAYLDFLVSDRDTAFEVTGATTLILLQIRRNRHNAPIDRGSRAAVERRLRRPDTTSRA